MEFESEILPTGNPDSGKKQHALGEVADPTNGKVISVTNQKTL
jgi:hypothetical protein